MSERWALIVEDDQELGTVFAEILEMAGVHAELARDGREALDVLAEVEPHLVILDLHLPEVSGPDVLAYMRRQERLRDTHVVIASADVARAQQLQEHVELVLVKPVGFDEIMELAERFFD